MNYEQIRNLLGEDVVNKNDDFIISEEDIKMLGKTKDFLPKIAKTKITLDEVISDNMSPNCVKQAKIASKAIDAIIKDYIQMYRKSK